MKSIPISILLTTAVIATGAETPEAAPATGTPVVQESGVPARFLAENLDQRIEAMRARLAIAKRERGPFGLYQVPSKTPKFLSPIEENIQKAPFRDFINQIEISVINAKEKEFLVGARMFRLGQEFPIVSGKERFSVRVESVGPSRVSFKDIKTGEVAHRKLDILPVGVTASVGALNVPGVTRRSRTMTAPLHLNFNSRPSTP